MTEQSIFENKQVAQNYEASYQNQYKRADVLEKKLLTKLLGQFPNAKTIVEVGCGTAHFTRWLQTMGYQCVGLDLSSSMLAEAKKLWSQTSLIRGDGSRLPIRDKSVDLVVFVTSFEFVGDAASALSEATRIADKGIIFGLLNKHSFSVLKRRIKGNKTPPFSRATFYSLSGIRKILTKVVTQNSEILFWNTTVFPRIFGNLESSAFPFGDFLGLAIKLPDSSTNRDLISRKNS
ncbi:MAG: class I SAM-dependent methyltransferase [Candidatus Bathyarchaeia archaeon]|jgi:ubiquinone/menaquinone biosynthesis C-methylase UbiE